MFKKWNLLIVFAVGCVVGVVGGYAAFSYSNKQQAKALFYLAGQYYEQKKYSIAGYYTSQSIAKNSDEYSSFNLLGDIYNISGEYELAGEMYKSALNRVDKKVIENKAYQHDKDNILAKIANLEKSRNKVYKAP